MLQDVEGMLCHPKVLQPYSMYKDGCSKVKTVVKASDPKVELFARAEHARFWERSLEQAQTAYDYGWGGAELSYSLERGWLRYEGMNHFAAWDVWALTTDRHAYRGISVQNVTAKGKVRLWGPGRFPAKAWFFAHNKRFNRFYGRSALYGAWRPWRRLAFRDGLEDIMDGAIYRNAYNGPEVRYPPDQFKKLGGQPGDVDYNAAREKAREFAESAKAGISYALPNTRDARGDYAWIVTLDKSIINVDGLINVSKYLSDEICWGVGVPPELIQAQDSGSGFSGRKIPIIAFYTGQQRLARALTWAWKMQIGNPLVKWNFGPDAWFEISVEVDLPEELKDNPNAGQPTGGQPPGAPAPTAEAAPPPGPPPPAPPVPVAPPGVGMPATAGPAVQMATAPGVSEESKKEEADFYQEARKAFSAILDEAQGVELATRRGRPALEEGGLFGPPEPLAPPAPARTSPEGGGPSSPPMPKPAVTAAPGVFRGGGQGWAPYTGARGGKGWQSMKTGRVVYQLDKPGEHEHHGDDDTDPTPHHQAAPAAPATKPAPIAPVPEEKTPLDIEAELHKPREAPSAAAPPIAPAPPPPTVELPNYGDWVRTPEGKVGVMQGSGGMGSGRVGVIMPSGEKSWENRSDLVRVDAPTPEVEPAEQPVKEAAELPIKAPRTAPPAVDLARNLARRFKEGSGVNKDEFWSMADQSFGGTRAEGKYGPSAAYDALEAGFNKALAGTTDPTIPLEEAQAEAKALADRVAKLPTQTNRSGNKEALQQFSTPPHYSYAVAWLANLKPGEVVLEPSAGTGDLTVHAQNAGATVYANELDPDRATLLNDQLGADQVFNENAEQIAGILPGKGMPAPETILMNPPFSQTAGRMGDQKDTMVGANHISEALQLLQPGGRLVAIVGRGMDPESPTFRAWFRKLKEENTLRANVGVSGDEYKKYGTHFGTRLLVIDKTGPHEGETVTGDAEDIPDLMAKLEGVRNGRARNAAEGPGLPGKPTGGPAGTEGRILPAGPGTEPTAVPGGTGELVRGRPRTTGPGPGGESGEGEGSVPGTPGGTGRGAPKVARSRRTVGRKPGQQPERPLPRLSPAEPVKLVPPTPKEDGSLPDTPTGSASSLYEAYHPAKVRIEGAQPHPSPLVESAAMSAVEPPDPTYQPHLSPDLIRVGGLKPGEAALSEAALESIVYAGQAHSRFLPAGVDAQGKELPPARRGYFIGDGTGAGKGRQIAGIMADNWNQDRKKHVWLTQKQILFEDAARDWADIGNDPKQVFHFDDLRKGKAPESGIAFCTYDTLKGGPKDPEKPRNIDTLVNWLGKDFDGVIAMDEAHTMSNSLATEGERGVKEASARALAGVELQKRLPKARVLYVSATGATEVSNLAYAERLGIWGRGTAFPTKQEFISNMDQGGVASMEAVAQSLKATGSYGARSLSFDDGTEKGRVTYDRLTHHLTADQHEQYNAAADGWQEVLRNIDRALEITGGSHDRNEKGAAYSQFWGSQQRFFNQVMTSMQTPSVIAAMEKDLVEGRSPVVQLTNTMEAALKKARGKQQKGETLDDLDVSPKAVLMQYLEKSFPVDRYEQYKDADGNVRSRPVKDAQGNAVQDPRAVAMREALLDKLGSLRIPESPLDMIINHFGHEQVAEATGRHLRVIKMDVDGKRELVEEKRNPTLANQAEAAAFQAGKKKIMIFSDAGGTGRSYHASLRAENQAQRVHYLLQPGWRADNAVQGLGRTHRTNQTQAPTYRLVEIDELKAQKRFISTIARRLDQLGALTKGQREAGSSGLFKAADNLESREAQHALIAFFHDLDLHQVPGLDRNEVLHQLGLLKEEDPEHPQRSQEIDYPKMSTFLNRLLSLRVDMQAKVFDAFSERLTSRIEQAIREKTLDTGVEDYEADSITRKAHDTVYKDPETGAEAKHFVAHVRNRTEKRPFKANEEGKLPIGFVRNSQSGRVYSVYEASAKTITKSDPKTGVKAGDVIPQYRLQGPTSMQFRPQTDLSRHNSTFEKLEKHEAKPLWEDEYQSAPEFYESDAHFITGAMLPIWDRIPGNYPKIYRLKMDDGSHAIGRWVHPDQVPTMLRNLGVHHEAEAHKPSDIHRKLKRGDISRATLANGWRLKPARVQGEERIELVGPDYAHSRELIADGVVQERINYNTRYFVPTNEDGVKVLEKITKSRPITEVEQTE